MHNQIKFIYFKMMQIFGCYTESGHFEEQVRSQLNYVTDQLVTVGDEWARFKGVPHGHRPCTGRWGVSGQASLVGPQLSNDSIFLGPL